VCTYQNNFAISGEDGQGLAIFQKFQFLWIDQERLTIKRSKSSEQDNNEKFDIK